MGGINKNKKSESVLKSKKLIDKEERIMIHLNNIVFRPKTMEEIKKARMNAYSPII